MVEFTRRKSMRRTFERIRMDENDLARLGYILQSAADKSQGSVSITIISGDGQETIRTPTANFFLDSQMPPVIREVRFEQRAPQGTIASTIDLSASEFERAEISVEGEDRNLVSGVFHELVREMQARGAGMAWFKRTVDSFLGTLAIGLLLAAAIYSLFDGLLSVLDARRPGFPGSSLRAGIVAVGWMFVMTGMVAGQIIVARAISRAFPTVEFAGRLSDPSSASRTKVLWIGFGIGLPIVLNVLAGLIVNALS